MSERPDNAVDVGGWMKKAENDLRNADYVLTLPHDCPTDTVCFHAQQCAEKYLKALLLWRGVAFPRTHDLVVLFNLVPQDCELHFCVEEVQPLNRYSVEARYPGDWDPIDMKEAAEAVQRARAIRDAVRSILPAPALD